MLLWWKHTTRLGPSSVFGRVKGGEWCLGVIQYLLADAMLPAGSFHHQRTRPCDSHRPWLSAIGSPAKKRQEELCQEEGCTYRQYVS